MAILFHRPFDEHKPGDLVELDPSMEYMLVSQNYANYAEKPKEEPKPKAKKVKGVIEGEEA